MTDPFAYIKSYYKVAPHMNQAVTYKGRNGQIVGADGSAVTVNFLDEKVTARHNIHPTDKDLVYQSETLKPRKMTRSQLRYRRFLDSDTGLTFAEFLGVQQNYH